MIPPRIPQGRLAPVLARAFLVAITVYVLSCFFLPVPWDDRIVYARLYLALVAGFLTVAGYRNP
jgi:hypothetical protein